MKRDSWNLALTSGRSLLALQGALCLIACDEPRGRRAYESREVLIHHDVSTETDNKSGFDHEPLDHDQSWRDIEGHLSEDSGADLGPETDSTVESDLDASAATQLTDDHASLFETQRYHIRAQIKYMDRLYDAEGFEGEHTARAAPYVLTQLVTQSPLGDEEIIAERYTDSRGRVELSWTRRVVKGSASPLPPLWVRALATQRTPEGSRARVTSRRRGSRYALDGPRLVSKRFKPISTEADSEYMTDQVITATTEGSLSGALNILSMTALGFDLISHHSLDSGPQLTIRWDLDLPVSCGSCYSSDQLTIFLGGQVEDPDHYDDHIILHEMGHFFSDQWSVDSSPGGPHRGRAVSPQLAYGEGLAYFWSALALDDPLIVDWMFPNPWVVDIESGIYNGAPVSLGLSDPSPATSVLSELSATHHEELVSTLMWDVYDDDSDGEPDDELALSEAQVMRSLISILPARYQAGADIGARGVDLADWLDALSCEVEDEEMSLLPLLELEASRRGYPWRPSSESISQGSEDPDASSFRRCDLKGSALRALIHQDKAGALWLKLNPQDPLANADSPQRAQRWTVRRWRGRPPKSEELSALECSQIPCRVAERADQVLIFELTRPSAESEEPLEARRFTSWIPKRLLNNSPHTIQLSRDGRGALLIEKSVERSDPYSRSQ